MPLPPPPPPPEPPGLVESAPPALTLREIGRWDSGRPGVSAAEVPAWTSDGLGLLVTDAERGLRLLDASDPAAPREAALYEAPGVNSVAVSGGRIAAAIAGGDPAGPGRLVVLDAELRPVAEAATGVGPDMVAAGPDGSWLTADEGQPAAGVDPPGGLTRVAPDAGEAGVVRLPARPGGIRSGASGGGPETLEPEYVAVSADGSFACVALQENNAVAFFDLQEDRFTDVVGLGLLERSAPGAGFDASDRDGGVRIHRWPVSAMPQPDAVALRTVGGRTFLLTANEGETRDASGGDPFTDATRVADLPLDTDAFPEAAWLKQDDTLGRLEVVRPGAHPAVDPDGDGDADRLVAFGGRSVSVFEVLGAPGSRELALRWNSGDLFERLAAERAPGSFNAGTRAADSRSEKRGPEPEGLVLGEVGGRVHAFVGLERSHAVVALDVTDPLAPTLSGSVFAGVADRAPEGLAFLPAGRSPTGGPLLAVAYEATGTLVIYAIGEN
ncbi:choice-of-anchor I family protein [Phycisphaera mikurensis]|uniref:Choice-of-anchor I domain-containing protein n=1 Tax=Phycisphaera mikurensis (strain NBRC 102666 / KCTC 22515 / FYK2301M01) TaxID=1142394 RepID=I0IBZ6_PHYMF|nr:choice-of-anchor I family protein [Phycisphaera mikurensis]MBB6441992.1 hypothetical protein [Phycisphaera mikurensis]BAM02784.1 hypothetical protein PSMK_06250 [Phycisphaera mikurensis NBRC 102666]